MGSLQWINTVVGWERKLEYEEERRKHHRSEPYVNYLAAPQRRRKEPFSFFARIFRQRAKPQPVYSMMPGNRAECAIITPAYLPNAR